MCYMPDPYAIKELIKMARRELKACHDHTFNDEYAQAHRAAKSAREHLTDILTELRDFDLYGD